MCEPIRVLHMIGNLDMGGSQAMVLNLYRMMNRNKIQFDFILDHPEQNALVPQVKELGAKIYVMPTFKGKNIGELRRKWNSFFRKHPEYRVLHSHVRSYAAIYLPIAKKYGVKTIIHSHSMSNGKGIVSLVKKFLQYPLRYQADYYLGCSDVAGEWLFGKKVVKSNKYRTIPNSIDTTQYKYSEEERNKLRSELGIEDKFVVGHVGRMTAPKNHGFLLKVFKELLKIDKQAILLLVGNGEMKEEIEAQAKRLGIDKKVIFAGEVESSIYYQAMDVFVFPSLWEGLGMVVVEAQTSGLPCLVSENIPKAADVNADLFVTMELAEGDKKWAIRIEELKNVLRCDAVAATVKAGYDVRENAQKMERFYIKLVNRR